MSGHSVMGADRGVPAGLASRRACAVVCALIAMVSACRGGADRPGEMQWAGSLEPASELAAGPVASARSRVDFFRPMDLVVIGDSVYVVDNGNDNVVVLNRRLEALGVLGREGEGPGEYRQPVVIRQSPRGIIIADMGNSRFTEIDRAGTVVRSATAPSGIKSFAVTRAGEVVVPSRDGHHHFAIVREQGQEEMGQWLGAGPANERNRDERLSIEAGFHDPRVAVTSGDTVHVFDEDDGVLFKYSPTGAGLWARSVPHGARDSAMAERDRLVAGLAKNGINVLSSPLSRGLSVTPDGQLLLLLAAGGTFAILVDPATYAARRIAMPGDSALRSIFRSARAATVVDSTLYFVRDISIYAFRLRPAG